MPVGSRHGTLDSHREGTQRRLRSIGSAGYEFLQLDISASRFLKPAGSMVWFGAHS